MKKTASSKVQSSKFPPSLRLRRASKIRNLISVIAIFFAGFIYISSAKGVLAQYFSYSPNNLTKKVEEQFTVTLNINTESKQVKGADAKISFDTSVLEIVSVEKGDFFPKGGYNVDTDAGTMYFSYGFDQALKTSSGTGSYITLTLKGKKAGTANLTWVCTAQTSDTNVWDANSNDIVNCSSNVGGNYTIVEDTGDDSSPTATPVPDTGSNPTATPVIPTTGVTLPTVFSLGVGILLTIVGLAFTI